MVDKVKAREVVETVLDTVINSGDGEVFHEDVAAIMASLSLPPLLSAKVAATLESIVWHRKVAEGFRDDPHWAYDKYIREGNERVTLDRASTEFYVQEHTSEAEQGVNLIVGLTALAQ